MFSLQNKKAVITGGGSGIGRAIAALFAKQGAEVHIIDLSIESAQDAVEEIKNAGGNVFSYACNVSSQADVKATFEKIGNINILINNAGIANVGKVDTTSEADFDRVMDVNVKGVYNCLFAAIPQFRLSNGGVILNMASIAAWVGISDRFAYSTAKGAVMAMTLSVARDYLSENIRCNSISPARVHTPFVDGFISKNYAGKEEEMFDKLSKSQPIGRMGKPDEIAALALYLCSEEAGFITGCDYPIDGGFIKLNN
ncbi:MULTISPECIES: SDR family NAD(P)-dependent oxidoreductase [Flavobacterium]|jgi:NAD(P)-dependent dehydrogenase (short-subunit alcohol dehydrogenase family)|uniref:Short-chain dehydrogenase/reductase SDR n=1 Tax=Flavobacterium johnsoniae (strain ATCC 17061 / DSM 2064 / JCM 8514 / BCRC 14874 / CCUG 350202 / NBRC 14942 / NCIMB 11054 / UW101) TaxID=376686 RepID=A5FCD9_FLAJ1|nr:MULTISPECIES: SDR family oxidoreductase [Flavobacterium]ABQ07129.1 short-chain dehydrogenase/reductase SDR [Flavobacterium johnsoniae UW101]OXE98845.1 short-chain dehydrogenase [Flavobacterium johnsoniae UW101]RXM45065.1 NAD(P)-dependent oxidoreductase [Flavobacterium sp. YO64]WDF57850.1 SDR family NAD(P)-dependent oxidoreductase [Flavobacterium sp. KACC 22758]WQG81032.1 SDR family oxidoreductase [Flavobacterium johnsoniae UW101]